MSDSHNSEKAQYEKSGFFLREKYFLQSELLPVIEVTTRFHEAWKKENHSFYSEKAINSAYLTGTKYLSNNDRQVLFKFIASQKIADALVAVPFKNIAFMNTQLFFNPVNPGQTNYWHRDPQYHLSLTEQQQALAGPEVIHIRVPLSDEPGMELVPGTHRRWDTDEELAVRTEIGGRKNHESLTTGKAIALNAGDVLVFSANMIHRGLYGGERVAFDIMFSEADPDLLLFANPNCLPDDDTLATLEVPKPFVATRQCLDT